jgi:hypothetical protein
MRCGSRSIAMRRRHDRGLGGLWSTRPHTTSMRNGSIPRNAAVGASGVVVCNAPNDQWDPFVVSSGSGAAIVGWMDQRADRPVTSTLSVSRSMHRFRHSSRAPSPRSFLAGVRVEWRLSEAAD